MHKSAEVLALGSYYINFLCKKPEETLCNHREKQYTSCHSAPHPKDLQLLTKWEHEKLRERFLAQFTTVKFNKNHSVMKIDLLQY